VIFYGISIVEDMRGVTRPGGVSWDIGAFEYNPDAISPDAPINLNVQ